MENAQERLPPVRVNPHGIFASSTLARLLARRHKPAVSCDHRAQGPCFLNHNLRIAITGSLIDRAVLIGQSNPTAIDDWLSVETRRIEKRETAFANRKPQWPRIDLDTILILLNLERMRNRRAFDSGPIVQPVGVHTVRRDAAGKIEQQPFDVTPRRPAAGDTNLQRKLMGSTQIREFEVICIQGRTAWQRHTGCENLFPCGDRIRLNQDRYRTA